MIHVHGQALRNRPTGPSVGINECSAGEGPDSIEMPDFVQALTWRLGEDEERSNGERQDSIERREFFEPTENLLDASMDWHSAGFPVVGRRAMTLETPIQRSGERPPAVFLPNPAQPPAVRTGGWPRDVPDSFS